MTTTPTTPSKLADPRYVPGLSGNDDEMTDAEWYAAMGEPAAPPLACRSIGIMYYPQDADPYQETVTVDPEDVSRRTDGVLMEYLLDRETMDHGWTYALPEIPPRAF